MTKKCVFQQRAVTFSSHLLNVTIVMQSVHCMINIDKFLTSVGKEAGVQQWVGVQGISVQHFVGSTCSKKVIGAFHKICINKFFKEL